MRRWSTVAASATILLACHDTPTSPPSGLPVTLSYLSTATPAVPVAGGGDSAVISVPVGALNVPFCASTKGDAGVIGHVLVATVTASIPVNVMCVAAPTILVVTAQAVVRHVPPGAYVVILRRRDVYLGGTVNEYEVARGPLTLP